MNNTSLPNSATLTLRKAQQCVYQQDYGQAHVLLNTLLKQFPHSGEVNFDLGKLYKKIGEFDLAIQCLTQTCRLMPNNFYAIFSLMDTFEIVNAHQDVSTLNDFMLAQFSHEPEVLYKAAQYFSETGQFTQAIKCCRRCIKKTEKSPTITLLLCYAWLLLVKLDESTHNIGYINKLSTLLNNSRNNSPPAMLLNYTLGEIFHKMKRPQNAFIHWQSANDTQRQQAQFHTEELAAFFAQIMETHSTRAIQNVSVNDAIDQYPTPIFIVGLPRTGSTLLEMLLSQHSKIDSIGEATVVSEHLAHFFSQHYKQPYPDFMAALAEDSQANNILLQQARAIYLSAISKRQITSPFVIDKLPANFQSIGLIKRIFPYAKIIHLNRDFNDVALSIFRHHFASHEPYFCNLSELHIYHDFYKRVMHHWEKMFATEILSVQYEDLVAQPAVQISRILQYCGLDFESVCTNPPLTGATDTSAMHYVKPIKTLSAVHVRSPVTSKSVGSALPYVAMMEASLQRATV